MKEKKYYFLKKNCCIGRLFFPEPFDCPSLIKLKVEGTKKDSQLGQLGREVRINAPMSSLKILIWWGSCVGENDLIIGEDMAEFGKFGTDFMQSRRVHSRFSESNQKHSGKSKERGGGTVWRKLVYCSFTSFIFVNDGHFGPVEKTH